MKAGSRLRDTTSGATNTVSYTIPQMVFNKQDIHPISVCRVRDVTEIVCPNKA